MTNNLTHNYTTYGYTPLCFDKSSLLSFNGEPLDLLTGLYILGAGYRPYSAALMRYTAPDILAPFGAGGLNTYSYNNGDPTNYTDPTGHFKASVRVLRRLKPKMQTRSQLLMNLDSPAHVITPSSMDAPPYFSSSPHAFSSPVSPPNYNPGHLPPYSRRLPKGHTRAVVPTLTPSGARIEPPPPPKYERLPARPQIKTSLPPERVERYRTELQEESARAERIRRNIRAMRRTGISVPDYLTRNLENIRQHRDRIRGLLYN
ncbi:RHS repeat-associated core domain-containing protein [Pseudomonas alabamensis]|uniref:RHS repeat-associated core domain-containing protein n=1 Tax=Pseudomonas alabamensis TaxID=3064349 RepID=UPI0021D9D548|nr:RHS repeat-associated core domain-containing protein [Pseudomonas entomophila]